MIQSAPERRFVAVIAALQAELRQLHRARAQCTSDRGIRVFQSGAGYAASHRAAERAVAAGAGALVSWGLAGGLQPRLGTGSVIIATAATDSAGARWQAHEGWVTAVLSALPAGLTVESGLLYCSDRMLVTPDAKAAAARRSGALGVDMETHAIAAVAAQRQVPWIGVRVVADSLLHGLPAGLSACVDDDGNTRLAGVLHMLLRPGRWLAFANLAVCYRRADRSLALLASGLLPTAFAAPPVLAE